ncbi:unnamed protein product [Rotaria socialis]|uniref:Uncharacterized protein n=1 Tax=Rotaria socialis TaxID=392032 RepID=A0A820VHM5_9BILA|nr:unnamed protein product [Rotaria socialis]CAF4500108.1 unnamed protein product [Rotaria socialis]CAF4766797.1 unnamed protein product [Rotaria socialis]
MDIGGYFPPCLQDLAHHHIYGNTWKLLGIVEDTGNGHQKYNRAFQYFPVRQDLKKPCIYSVARSQLKMTEDYNVGKSLVRAADTILRQSLDLRLEDHRVVGVIEFGNKALTFDDLQNIGVNIDRLIIASYTSADDELNIYEGLKQYKYVSDSTYPVNFSWYTIKRRAGSDFQLILLCDRNATNFNCRAILGESIRSVQAAMMICALNLYRSNRKNKSNSDILTLTNEEEIMIARLWLQHFGRMK